jgi:HNH endonuclease
VSNELELDRCSYGSDCKPDDCCETTWGWTPAWICDACEELSCEVFTLGELTICDDCVIASAVAYRRRFGNDPRLDRPSSPPDPNRRKPISHSKRMKIYERDGFKCRYCGSQKKLRLDHVIPHSRTQDDSEDNLVTSCQKCNAKKQDKTPDEAGMVLMPVSEALDG